MLLGLLRTPASGYDLRHTFETGAAHYWAAELSQIYPTLKRLEADGLVRVEPVDSSAGPPRRVYHRTAAGRRELVKWVRSGPVVGAQRLAYVGQIEFAHEAGDLELTAELVTGLRHEFQPLRDLLAGAVEEMASDPAGLDDADFHELLAMQLGLRTMDARLAWCEQAATLVAARRETGA